MVAKSLYEIWTPVPFYPVQLIRDKKEKQIKLLHMHREWRTGHTGARVACWEGGKQKEGGHVLFSFSLDLYLRMRNKLYTLSIAQVKGNLERARRRWDWG